MQIRTIALTFVAIFIFVGILIFTFSGLKKAMEPQPEDRYVRVYMQRRFSIYEDTATGKRYLLTFYNSSVAMVELRGQ